MEGEAGEETGGAAAGGARGRGGPRWLVAGPRQRWCPVQLLSSLDASCLRLEGEEKENEEEKEEEVTEESDFAQLLFMMSLYSLLIQETKFGISVRLFHKLFLRSLVCDSHLFGACLA